MSPVSKLRQSSSTSSSDLVDQLQVVNVCSTSSTIYLPSFSSSLAIEKQVSNLSLFYYKTWDEKMEIDSILAASPQSFRNKWNGDGSRICDRTVQVKQDCSSRTLFEHGAERKTTISQFQRRIRKRVRRNRSYFLPSFSCKCGEPLSREMWLTKVPHLVWGTAPTLPPSTQLQLVPDRQSISSLQAKLVWVTGKTMEQYFLKTFPLIASLSEGGDSSVCPSFGSHHSTSSSVSAPEAVDSSSVFSASVRPFGSFPYYLIINYGVEPLYVNMWRVERGHSCVLQHGDWISFLESALDRYAGIVEPLNEVHIPSSGLPPSSFLKNSGWKNPEKRGKDHAFPLETIKCRSRSKKEKQTSKKILSSLSSERRITLTITAKEFQQKNDAADRKRSTHDVGTDAMHSRGVSSPLEFTEGWKPQSPLTHREPVDVGWKMLPLTRRKWSTTVVNNEATLTRSEFCSSVVRTLLTALDKMLSNYEEAGDGSIEDAWWLHLNEEDFFHKVWRWRACITDSPERQVRDPNFSDSRSTKKALAWCVPRLSSSVLRWLYHFHDREEKWRVRNEVTSSSHQKKQRTFEDSSYRNKEGDERCFCFLGKKNASSLVRLRDVIFAPASNANRSQQECVDDGSDKEEDEEEMIFRIRAPSPLLERWKVSVSSSPVSSVYEERTSSSHGVLLSPASSALPSGEFMKKMVQEPNREDSGIGSLQFHRLQLEKTDDKSEQEKMLERYPAGKKAIQDEKASFDSRPLAYRQVENKVDPTVSIDTFKSLASLSVSPENKKVEDSEKGKNSVRNCIEGGGDESFPLSHSMLLLHLIPAPLPVYRFVSDTDHDGDSKSICALDTNRHHLLRRHSQLGECEELKYYYYCEAKKNGGELRKKSMDDGQHSPSWEQNAASLWIDLSPDEKTRKKTKKRRV